MSGQDREHRSEERARSGAARGSESGVPNELERVNPPELARAAGFSHAVLADTNRIVFLAGQTAMDAEGRIVGDGVVAQFEQALGNLLTALRAAGGEPRHLAALTVYAVDLADYKVHAREIGGVWKRLIGTDYPAMAGIGIARLWDDEALVEVQGIAALPG
jgi:enamine deaminase RidA (YjgF/YER057c/UK114 family)